MEIEMKTHIQMIQYKQTFKKAALRLIAVAICIQLLVGLSLVSGPATLAQGVGQAARGQNTHGILRTDLPQIVRVTELKELRGGVPKQQFDIVGRNFSEQKADNKIYILKRAAESRDPRLPIPRVEARPRYDLIATLTPDVAWKDGLRATLTTRLSAGEYLLQVEVAGVGRGNLKTVEVLRMKLDLDFLKLEISTNVQSAKPRDEVVIRGNFRNELVYHVWFYHRADPTYRVPLVISSKGDTYRKGKLSELMKAGLYDVYATGTDTRRDSPGFGKQVKSNTIGFKVEAVSPDYFHEFVIEYRGIECFKESADGPGADEVYMSGIVYRVDAFQSYKRHGSIVYDSVDANDKRIDPQILLTFGQQKDDINWNPEKRRFSLSDYAIVIALGEFDGEEKYHRTLIPAFEASKYTSDVLWKGGTREQVLEKVKESLRSTIDDTGRGFMLFSEDDTLGVEELTFSAEELQKAVYFNGQPVEKSLHFRGDDSHYRAIFHLRLARPIQK
jgi:hypothetical protein